jgi:hypothetical protein
MGGVPSNFPMEALEESSGILFYAVALIFMTNGASGLCRWPVEKADESKSLQGSTENILKAK